VTNLVTNALRYSYGSDPIEVGAAACEGGIEIWVRDQGAGIPIEKYAQVFDLGLASGDGHDGGANGSGLGLYISKRLVEAHGGRLWVEEEAGRGRGFRFRLAAPV
jgi:signal transduction histidine kinase